MGDRATIKKVHVKNKQQFINMLNLSHPLIDNGEEPYGEIYKGSKKQLEESIKKHYSLIDYTSYTITDWTK